MQNLVNLFSDWRAVAAIFVIYLILRLAKGVLWILRVIVGWLLIIALILYTISLF